MESVSLLVWEENGFFATLTNLPCQTLSLRPPPTIDASPRAFQIEREASSPLLFIGRHSKQWGRRRRVYNEISGRSERRRGTSTSSSPSASSQNQYSGDGFRLDSSQKVVPPPTPRGDPPPHTHVGPKRIPNKLSQPRNLIFRPNLYRRGINPQKGTWERA